MLTARAVLTTAGVDCPRCVDYRRSAGRSTGQSRRAVLTTSDTAGAVLTARAVLTAAGAGRAGVLPRRSAGRSTGQSRRAVLTTAGAGRAVLTAAGAGRAGVLAGRPVNRAALC